jgi:hypothetical protein
MSQQTTSGRARLAQMVACIALALSASAATANGSTEDEIGELMGDLMFHADLMSSLDSLCPGRSQADDWRAVVRQLPAHARTRELQDLSRRLTADASRAMVRASGGCTTRDYAQLYAETRRDFEALRKRWAWYSV